MCAKSTVGILSMPINFILQVYDGYTENSGTLLDLPLIEGTEEQS